MLKLTENVKIELLCTVKYFWSYFISQINNNYILINMLNKY